MRKIFVSPPKYVQGAGELSNLAAHIADYGKKALLVAHPDDKARVASALDACGEVLCYDGFGGECSSVEIERLRAAAERLACDAIVGLGGGKALDTAKSVAHYHHAPVIIVPTIAATDAPCSGSSVIYSPTGEFESYLHFRQNPDAVIVDTDIIAKAPVRFLVAGMGDAMSTWFEARACLRANADNNKNAKNTKAALAIARQCYDTLIEDSLKAKAACEMNVVTPALENIVEANILLSGLGFESGGLAAAHAVHNGLTKLEETHRYYHGEKVAFGTVVHLVLENAPSEELDTVIGYFKSVGLPTCLKDLGVETVDPARMMEVAEAAVVPGETIHHMPFPVSAQDVYAAILTADQLGR